MDVRIFRPPLDRRRFVRQSLLASLGLSVASCARRPMGRSGVPAGRLVAVDIPGPELDAETEAFIRRYRVRSVLLFQRNIVDSSQTRRLTARLRRVMGPGALIAIDQEGGAVVRTRDLPFPPSAMSLGAAGSSELAYEVGHAVGRMLNHLGINWNFAPSLDVNSNPLNPVISDRSFGSDPQHVARLGLAWAEGLEAGGVAPCVKHFPGHGDTVTDSHLGLPVVEKDRAALRAVELYPFEQAVLAAVPSIMTAHIVFPAFDPVRPATLAPAILSELLREAWGYDGVVVTDAMNMRAITETYGRGEAAVMALTAGADLVLAQGVREDQLETLTAIEAALEEGLIARQDWGRSVRRTGQLAARFPAEPADYSEEQRRQDAALFERAWARGLTPYRDPRPPEPGSPVLLVMADDAAGGGASNRGLRSADFIALLRGIYDLSVVTYSEEQPGDSLAEIQAQQRPGMTTLFVSTGRHRPDEAMRRFIQALSPDLHVALWNPYTVLDVPAPALIAYGFRLEALRAVASWLKGDIAAQGRAPIELDGGV